MYKYAPAIALAFTLFTTGCDVTTAGEDNVVSFRLDAAVNAVPVAFDTPIAVGMSVDVLTLSTDTAHSAVAVTSATSENAAVVVVEGTSGNRISLRAVSVGTARVTVETANGADAFTVTTADIAKVDLKAPGVIVSDNPQSLGIQGGTARFFVTLKNASDKLIVGHGALPIAVEPSTAATFIATPDVGFVDLQMNETGSVALKPEGAPELIFDIIAPELVTGLDLRGLDVTSILRGAAILITLRGTTDLADKVVGVASLATFTSATPEKCTVTAAPRLGEGVFEIKGLAAGACQVGATYATFSDTRDLDVLAP